MSDSLADLILSLTPEDGASIGNAAILARLRDDLPNLTEEDYAAARDALVDEGLLAKGKGRGGSIYRTDVSDLTLEMQEGDEPQPKGAGRARRAGTASPRRTGEPAEILSYRHGETRVNNPEVGMVHAGTDPDGAKTRWAYDPHLDPVLNFDSARAGIESLIDDALGSADPERMKAALEELKRLQAPYLNWTGKAERTSFEVDTVSLHVHERVDPATILASVAKRLKGKDAASQWRQPDLFAAPFENLPLRQALDFYHHEKGWSNRLIAGDSLLVMNSLLTKESMAGKVQMIYIDPPYGIKYGSNFQPFTSKRDVKDRSDEDLTQEPEMIKAFRDTWELGIHSYLTYLRDRLVLARELLAESGSIFIQISAENLHRARALMDEVLGAENHIETIAYRTKNMTLGGQFLEGVFDYIIWYAKNKKIAKFRTFYKPTSVEGDSHWNFYWTDGQLRKMTSAEIDSHNTLPDDADPVQLSSLYPTGVFETGLYDFEFQGVNYSPPPGRCWKSPKHGMARVIKAGRVVPYATGATVRYALRLSDYPVSPIHNIWADTAPAASKVYVVQTGEKVIERCLLMTTDPGDLVLDPTCGSGSTAFVAEKWGRRWITCDTSRVAIALAKQRLMTASFDYYALRYPQEGLKGGFEYETVPHITLKSISNNPDIDTIYDEEHPRISAALEALNNALLASKPPALISRQGSRKGEAIDFANGQTLEEWEVPFDWPGPETGHNWSDSILPAFTAYHAARKTMQRRMDQSIADNAEQETLYDKPRIDRKKLRICGPFSVEAVPSPTVLSLDESLAPQEADESIARSGETSRQALWRDELLKTGVRAKGGAILSFAEFETLPGLKYVHASGTLSDSGERVIVSFGPEHAALEQRQVELALSEAEKLRPAPKFILFCAFTFDPEAAKDIDEINWPGVTLLKAQMNTDLLTEDLKKNRASNQSFWLMGQPDIELRKRKDGLFEVEVNGFDYFDPKKGDLVSGGKKQIAMWSLDTDYDNRSLMPHQVFFPMADDKGGWNRLRATIRDELDTDLLDQFHKTVSLPFEAGDNRRIAVKIVDDRGIESLKIMTLEG
ncbi:site-specific DNA-methyltransferase [Ochrobactrum sp. EEELCW01]|nr:site-specific DNA-methyltransferase [Ochrobactrum sp. EEELCW01]